MHMHLNIFRGLTFRHWNVLL